MLIKIIYSYNCKSNYPKLSIKTRIPTLIMKIYNAENPDLAPSNIGRCAVPDLLGIAIF
jgi:hypothetical protein